MTKVTLEQLLLHSKLKIKDAETLAERLTGMSGVEILLRKKEYTVSEKIVKKFRLAEKKILSGVPLQYIFGKCNFYGREFAVNKNVLIPRPETELLVEQAIKFIKLPPKADQPMAEKVHKIKPINIIDVGTGSGCIIISLKKEIEKLEAGNSKLKADYFATDISSAALYVAKGNAKKHHANIKFYKSDLFSNPRLPEKFDLILANLPYLPSDYLQENSNLKYEPRLALDGGRDGLKTIKKLIETLPQTLNKNGRAILETDPRQKEKIIRQINQFKNLTVNFKKDLNQITRSALITKGLDN